MTHLLAILSPNGPFEYFTQHIQAIAWPAVFVCIWRVSKAVERVKTQAVKTIDQIDEMASNHFPHMETSLAKQDVLLTSMDVNIKTIADNSHRRREEF
jgi:hypothetical protein